jgi:hypothetical protein
VEVSINTSVSYTASHSVPFLEKVANGVLHEDVNPFMNASFLQCTNDFETGGISDVSKTREGMPSKVSLVDEMFLGSVKDSTPLLKFTHSVRGFLCMELCHAPIGKPLASLHGIMEVDLPVVSRISVLQCSCATTFGHDCMCFPKQRFGDDCGFRSAAGCLNRSTEASTPSPDDNDIVFMSSVCLTHAFIPPKQRPCR